MKNIAERLFDIFEFIDESDKKKNMEVDSFVNQLTKLWNDINDDKYNEKNSKIIIVRIVNEFVRLKKTKEAEVWLHELDKIRPQSPQYSVDFFKGKTYYQLQEYDKAYEYLNKAYHENPSFFKKQEGKFADFLKKHE